MLLEINIVRSFRSHISNVIFQSSMNSINLPFNLPPRENLMKVNGNRVCICIIIVLSFVFVFSYDVIVRVRQEEKNNSVRWRLKPPGTQIRRPTYGRSTADLKSGERRRRGGGRDLRLPPVLSNILNISPRLVLGDGACLFRGFLPQPDQRDGGSQSKQARQSLSLVNNISFWMPASCDAMIKRNIE